MEESIKNDREKPVVKTSIESRRYTFTLKQLLVAGGVVVLVLAVLFVWRIAQVNGLQKKQAEDVSALKAQAKTELLQSSIRHLKLLAKPYTWAVRTAMLQSNTAQVNEYANDIVKEKNVVSVMVVDTKNTVVSSTDKKYEGKDYLSFGTAYYLHVDSATVNKVNDSLLVLASPVMSFNNKLGTVIFTYAVPPPRFSSPIKE